MAAQGNLIILFTVFLIYSFTGWGIGQLYNEEVTIDSGSLGQSGTFDPIGIVLEGFTVMTFQNEHIPVELNILIAGLNLLTFGAFLYWARGGGT